MNTSTYSRSSEGSFCRPLLNNIHGCHSVTKIWFEHRWEYFTFKNLWRNKTPVRQVEMEGGCANFHVRRLLRRVNMVVKAATSACRQFNEARSEWTLKMAVRGHDCRFCEEDFHNKTLTCNRVISQWGTEEGSEYFLSHWLKEKPGGVSESQLTFKF